ncbi:cytochrome P450 [Bradyrhizobium sp. ARR65]|uniref:cytochrome P450 n=1 Tax=Bradyrhizobium sp. ARR65 TaxID=1040989 RepID=UPI000467A165|nr:cytochrome P450 [Bradyrhizobium sp. ARR65]
MASIPDEGGLDHSLALVSEGYNFITNRCRKFNSDIFSTRLLGRAFYCIRGADAAAMFYEQGRFTRQGGLPNSVLHLLQDEGSVAVLDADAHHHRKAMMMSLMSAGRLQEIAELASSGLRDHARHLIGHGAVVMHGELRKVLCAAACRWAGIDLNESDLADLTVDIGAMIDNAGSVGPSNWIARVERHGAERLLRGIVEDVRAGRARPAEGTALHAISVHRDLDGELLSPEVAAVELLNILRPTVAIARFMTFALLALREHPKARQRLGSDDTYLEAFVQEVRRFYPFFPFVAGKARTQFDWRGCHFHEGDLFLLDLYGTCHDDASWDEPMAFRPERFIKWPGDPFTMIPQGGGDHFVNHRCAGEWLTINVMKAMLRTLARDIDLETPEQDLSIDLAKMPALPTSGFRAEVKALRE